MHLIYVWLVDAISKCKTKRKSHVVAAADVYAHRQTHYRYKPFYRIVLKMFFRTFFPPNTGAVLSGFPEKKYFWQSSYSSLFIWVFAVFGLHLIVSVLTNIF